MKRTYVTRKTVKEAILFSALEASNDRAYYDSYISKEARLLADTAWAFVWCKRYLNTTERPSNALAVSSAEAESLLQVGWLPRGYYLRES